MYKIFKITSNPTVDYAAEELKKYLRMMMTELGEIPIEYCPGAKDGFRLGLMSDFGLDMSDAEKPDLDDIVYIDANNEGGIIAGSNPGALLIAVYRYLKFCGCRWLFPGVDGEWVPELDVLPAVNYRKLADYRYRGQCNEGAEYQQDMLETIEFTPKIGMNTYMLEFDNPYAYYNSYYSHIIALPVLRKRLHGLPLSAGSVSARLKLKSADCISTIWATVGLPSPSDLIQAQAG